MEEDIRMMNEYLEYVLLYIYLSILFSFIYNFLQFVRLKLKHHVVTIIIEDLILETFYFYYFYKISFNVFDGNFRGYMIVISIVGIFIYFYFISPYVTKIMLFIYECFNELFNFIMSFICFIVKKLFSKLDFSTKKRNKRSTENKKGKAKRRRRVGIK